MRQPDVHLFERSREQLRFSQVIESAKPRESFARILFIKNFQYESSHTIGCIFTHIVECAFDGMSRRSLDKVSRCVLT